MPSSSERRIAIGSLPVAQDVILEAHGVRQRVHREGVLLASVRAEEIDIRAECQHEIVVRDRRDALEPRLAPLQIDACHPVLVDARVRLLAEEIAQRMPHSRRFEQIRGDLIEQGLERVIVVLVDQDDIDIGVLQFLSRAEAREATSEDEHARSRILVCGRLRDTRRVVCFGLSDSCCHRYPRAACFLGSRKATERIGQEAQRIGRMALRRYWRSAASGLESRACSSACTMQCRGVRGLTPSG